MNSYPTSIHPTPDTTGQTDNRFLTDLPSPLLCWQQLDASRFMTMNEAQILDGSLLTTETPPTTIVVMASKSDHRCIAKLGYSIDEAAAVCGVAVACIREAVSTGRLKATKKGRRWIIPSASLEKWVGS